MGDPRPPIETVPQQKAPHQGKLFLFLLLPLVLLGLAGAWLISSDPLNLFNSSAPPVESIIVEKHFLSQKSINLNIRASGSEPMIIAQVQVDDAYWRFTQTPPGPLSRFSSALIEIPYPWIEGDAHMVKLLTNTGTVFEHEIEVAIGKPAAQSGALWSQTILGLFVGVLPVALGLMLYPVLRSLKTQGMRFVLAMTCGMLAFLFIDTLDEALEAASQAAPSFQGTAMVLLIALMTTLGLIAFGRRRGVPDGIALAGFIAIGIGLHNLGEGLAIGAALAAGSAGLGAFLVLGFTVHNLTEGVAIAAPLVRNKPTILTFVAFALIAGAPAIVGIWLGSYAIAPHWVAIALAIGTGAILQVLFEVGSLILKKNKADEGSKTLVLDRYAYSGMMFGVAFMYVTGMLIKT
jgi:ZIP family zinc transporter